MYIFQAAITIVMTAAKYTIPIIIGVSSIAQLPTALPSCMKSYSAYSRKLAPIYQPTDDFERIAMPTPKPDISTSPAIPNICSQNRKSNIFYLQAL